LSAPEEKRGSVVHCPDCGRKVGVPSVKAPASAPPPPKDTRPAPAWGAPAKPPAKTPPKAPPAPPAPPARTSPDEPFPEEASPDEVAPDEDTLHDESLSQDPPEEEASDEETLIDELPPPKRKRPADAADDDVPAKPKRKKRRRKKKTRVVVGVLSTIGGLLFLAVIILILSGKWVDAVWPWLQRLLQDVGVPPWLAATITAVVLLVPGTLWYIASVKSGILDAMPDDIEFEDADAGEFEQLDRKRLQRWTDELEELGFEQLRDYTVVTELEYFPKGFARLFVHPQHHCFAEINQGFFPDGEPVPMRLSLASFLDDDWAVGATNRAAEKENWLMRRPQAAWLSVAGCKEAAELLEHHRKFRKEIMKERGLGLLEKLSAKTYFRREEAANRERKEVVRGRWALGIIIEFWLFDHKPKTEWRGA
jgi:hypothetical protein